MKKRILMLLANGFDPDPRVYNEAQCLVAAGYEVIILCWDRERKYPRREVVQGVKIERSFVPSSYGRGSLQVLYIWKFWMEAYKRSLILRPDIVHAHDFDTLPAGFWIGRKFSIPVVFDAHEDYGEMLAENVHPVLKAGIGGAERLLVKRIDLLITVGSLLEQEYAGRNRLKSAVIGNWKPLEDFVFSEERIKKTKLELGVPRDQLVISYVGYLQRSRGLLQMIEAVREAEGVFLVIGGKGALESRVRQAIRGAENILYLGYVAPSRVPLITAVSDVVYYGLENNNGNNKYSAPNKLFEALACGRAVITGNIGEIYRIVKEENCGIRLKNISKESLKEAFMCLQEKKVLEKYKRNAYIAAKRKYNWDNAKKILLDEYDSLLGNNRRV